MSNLHIELLETRDYVKNVVKPAYESIGVSGYLALKLVIEPALSKADEAIKQNDALLMMRALIELKEIKL